MKVREANHNIVEPLIDFLQDLYDEFRWYYLFKKTEKKLVAAAQQARQEITEGKAKPMDYDKL